MTRRDSIVFHWNVCLCVHRVMRHTRQCGRATRGHMMQLLELWMNARTDIHDITASGFSQFDTLVLAKIPTVVDKNSNYTTKI